jgi:hypothetical protein
MELTIIYDPILSETHIGDFKISDQLLAEMGISMEDLLKQIRPKD